MSKSQVAGMHINIEVSYVSPLTNEVFILLSSGSSWGSLRKEECLITQQISELW